jgi:uncharacterized protein (TIGR03382 family)
LRRRAREHRGDGIGDLCDEAPPKGCGCDAGPAVALWPLAALLLRRKRRRTAAG